MPGMSDTVAREPVVHARIGDLGLEAFPDDGVVWPAAGIRHRDGRRARA